VLLSFSLNTMFSRIGRTVQVWWWLWFLRLSTMCFVDFKKAFDLISHDKLWVAMIDLHLIDLLAKLHRKQLAKVKVAGTLSE